MSTLSQPRSSTPHAPLAGASHAPAAPLRVPGGPSSMRGQGGGLHHAGRGQRAERAGGPLAQATIDPLRVLRRYAFVILASGVVGAILGGAAFIALQQFYPLYSGMVVFEVRPGLQKSSDVGTVDVANDDMVFRVAQTEAYMLTSRDVLEAALKNPDVQATDWSKQFVRDGVFNHAAALKELEEEIGTSVRRASNLFMLHWSAHRPSDVPVILNAVAAAYENRARQRDDSMYNGNQRLFNDQLTATQRELTRVNGEINNLIIQSGMTSLDDTRWSAQMYHMQEMTRMGTAMETQLNMAIAGLSLVRQQLKGSLQPNPEDRLLAERDPSLHDLNTALRFVTSNWDELRKRYPDDNPQVIKAWHSVESKRAEFDAHVKEVMYRNLQAKATELENEVKRLESARDENARQIDAASRTLKELAGKQAELETLRSQREYLQERRAADLQLVNEVTMMKARKDASRVMLAQSAFTPREPSFPKAKVVVPLGVLLLMALTTGLIFLREMLDKRVKSASDLGMLPGAHVLGSLPDSGDDPTRVISAELCVRRQPTSVLAESYRQVATAVMPELDLREAQTLLLMGGLPEAGTTTVATNLAAAIAATGRSVLVVDANFRRPGLGKAMGIADDAIGLGDVLAGSTAVDQAIHPATEICEGVDVMPAGTPAMRVIEKLNNGVIDGVLADLRSRYDVIIFDAPPAVVAGDAMMLANKVDAAILVVRANQEHRGLVVRMINRLNDSRCELLGVLLNRPRGIAGGYLKKNYAAMAGYSKNGTA